MSNFSLDYCIDEFMIYCRSRDLRRRTLDSYEHTLRLFERWCEVELKIDRIRDVSEQVIRRYITNLQERGKYTFYADEKSRGTNFPERRRDYRQPVTTATINNYIRNLKVFFNWLNSEHWLNKNPMKKVKQLKTCRQKKEYLSDDDFKKLVGHLDKSYFSEHRDYAMIVLMLDTGMRLGECSSLLVSDIQLARHQIVLRAEMTKGRKDRTVFFSQRTESILRRWLQYKDRYLCGSGPAEAKKHTAPHAMRGVLRSCGIRSVNGGFIQRPYRGGRSPPDNAFKSIIYRAKCIIPNIPSIYKRHFGFRCACGDILSADEAFEEICCDALGKIGIFAGPKRSNSGELR